MSLVRQSLDFPFNSLDSHQVKSVFGKPMRSIIPHFRRPVWPHPQESIGKAHGPYQDSKMAYWEAKGPALEVYNELIPKIKKILEERQGPLPNSDFIWFDLYMVGPNPDVARPHIMFTGENKSARKRAMNIIKESGLLAAHPGMHVGQWAEPPHIGKQLLSADTVPTEAFDSRGIASAPRSIEIESFSTGTRQSITLKINFTHTTVRATSGLVWEFQGREYWLLAAHVFFAPQHQEGQDDIESDAGSSDYDFDGFKDDNLEEISEYLGTSEDSLFAKAPNQSDDNDSVYSISTLPLYSSNTTCIGTDPENHHLSPISLDETPYVPLQANIPTNIHGNLDDCLMISAQLDYSLYRASYQSIRNPDQRLQILTSSVIVEPTKQGSTAQVHTSHGMISGIIKRTGAHVSLPGSSHYQEVLVAYLDRPISAGDSGAVVSNEKDQVYGHIVSGSSACVAFVVPASQVYDDIVQRGKRMSEIGSVVNTDNQSHHARRKVHFESIANRIQDAMKMADDPEKAFCRSSDLKGIWTTPQLRGLLFDCHLTTEQIEAIHNKLLGFLSFIVWTELPELEWFSTLKTCLFSPPNSAYPRFTDKSLPLDAEELISMGFNPRRVKKYLVEQYRFIPTTLDFSYQPQTQIIDSKYRLPFEFRSTEEISGGYDLINFYQVSPDYIQDRKYSQLSWGASEPYAVAVKSFRADEESLDDSKKEVDTLCRVKRILPSEVYRITLHQTIIEQDSRYLIVLPIADLGNLHQFLHAEPAVSPRTYELTPASFGERFRNLPAQRAALAGALVNQCAAIADALKFLHKGFSSDDYSHSVNLAHMDLKPDNILIYDKVDNPVGWWKVTDFGISVIKKVSKDGNVENQTMQKRARRPTSTYQAPEVERAWDDLAGRSTLGPKSDVWSMGAIFSEVLAFCQMGPRGVAEFRDLRRGTYDGFYSEQSSKYTHLRTFHHDPDYQLRPEVMDWLKGLRDRSRTELDYVACWTSCVESLLVADPEARPDAERMYSSMMHVYQHIYQFIQGGITSCIFPNQPSSSPPGILSRGGPRVLASRLPAAIAFESFQPLIPAYLRGRHPSSIYTGSDRPSHGSSSYGFEPSSPATTMGTMELPAHAVLKPSISMDWHNIETHVMSWDTRIKSSGSSTVTVGKYWIAYMAKSTITLLRIHPDKDGKNITEPAAPIVLPFKANTDRSGIVVSGQYLATWGESKRSEPMLQVFRLDYHNATSSPTSIPIPTKDFEHSKRIAITDEGFMAVINTKQFFILNLENPLEAQTRHTSRDVPLEQHYYIEDIAFNEDGNLLYVWATGRSQGWLLCYRIIAPLSIELEARTHYDFQDDVKQHITRLHPFSHSLGCLVALGDSHVAFVPDSVIPLKAPRKLRAVLVQPKLFDIRAAYLHQDQSLVVATSRWIPSSSTIHILPAKTADGFAERHTLCRIDSRLKAGSAMQIISCNNEDACIVLICQPDGKIHAIKCRPKA